MFGAFFSDVTNLGYLLVLGLVVMAVRALRPDPEPELEPQISVPAERIQGVLARVVKPAGLTTQRVAQPQAFDALPVDVAADSDSSDDYSNVAEPGLVARLAPQAPIRGGEDTRSWFGGAPEMPQAMPWPKISGRRGLFLAQICCADLPKGLWDGQGPRKGWLAFFCDAQEGREVRALHFAERAAPRTPPAPGACCTWRPAGAEGQGPRRIDAFPRWPLDIVAIGRRSDDPSEDPRIEGPATAQSDIFANGFDLASPEHHPFSWTSALALTDLALAAIKRRAALIKSELPDIEKKLASARRQLELGDMAPEMDRAMRLRCEDLPAVVEGWKESIATLDAASDKLQAIAEELGSRAEQPFSGEAVGEIMERLQAIVVTHVERRLDPSRGAEAETARIVRLPLTAHHPDVNFFVHEYEILRDDWAKHAYCAHAGALPAAQRDYFERIWRDHAAHEMSSMGHKPFQVVPGFNPNRQAVLIEFVSSELLNWRFGDAATLAVTIDKAALAKGDFSDLSSQITR